MIHGPWSAGQLGPFCTNPMRPKGGSQVGPKPQLDPPEPKLAKDLLDTNLAINPIGLILAMDHHGPYFQPWPLATTRSAQSAFPSTYGEFFPFLHTICT
ncbi:hypothetical protein O181_124833 [Austropuccinia psidii MF-1]|uniref:Uncharacterized protein n=1 Tax=Austropuccinia psidii MF-1 TaxID=1389203 RepID=A0A9Q3KNM6_9BASI|nr:hypothetical protein [Austropuccinia psidii MF-1]